jgi:subfamily B ATP-binding cassette protein MsbA
MVVGGLADAALVKLTGPLIDELFVHKNQSLAILLPLAIVAVFVVSGLASFVSGYTNQWVGNQVILDLRRQMFDRVLRLPSAYFDEATTAKLVARFTNDVNNIAAASTSVLTVLVRDSVTVAALLAILVWSNWRLTLIAFLVIPPIAVVVRLFSKRLRAMSRASQAGRWAASPRCSTSRSPTSAWCASSAGRRTRAPASRWRANGCAAST